MVVPINLGDRVRDIVSGFEGIATARYEYLNGCIRIAVNPEKLDNDSKYIESIVFDIQQLEVVATDTPASKVRRLVEQVVEKTTASGIRTRTGGPRDDSPDRHNPSR